MEQYAIDNGEHDRHYVADSGRANDRIGRQHHGREHQTDGTGHMKMPSLQMQRFSRRHHR